MISISADPVEGTVTVESGDGQRLTLRTEDVSRVVAQMIVAASCAATGLTYPPGADRPVTFN